MQVQGMARDAIFREEFRVASPSRNWTEVREIDGKGLKEAYSRERKLQVHREDELSTLKNSRKVQSLKQIVWDKRCIKHFGNENHC